MPIFWQGAAWTGYLPYGSSSASLVLWQLVTDCVLLGIILFLGIETGHRVSGFFPSSAVPEYHLLPEVKVLLFLLGAAAYFIKALLWVQLPQSMTGKTPAPVDSYIIRPFSLSTAIVSAYQTMRLTSLFWPDAAGRGSPCCGCRLSRLSLHHSAFEQKASANEDQGHSLPGAAFRNSPSLLLG